MIAHIKYDEDNFLDIICSRVRDIHGHWVGKTTCPALPIPIYYIFLDNSPVLGDINVMVKKTGTLYTTPSVKMTSLPGITITEKDLLWASLWAVEIIKNDVGRK